MDAALLLLQLSGGKSCIMALVPKCKEQQTEWMNYSIVSLHEWKRVCLQLATVPEASLCYKQ